MNFRRSCIFNIESELTVLFFENQFRFSFKELKKFSIRPTLVEVNGVNVSASWQNFLSVSDDELIVPEEIFEGSLVANTGHKGLLDGTFVIHRSDIEFLFARHEGYFRCHTERPLNEPGRL